MGGGWVVGGWVLDFTRLMLISTQVEVVVEVGVELGNYCLILQYDDYNWDWSLQHVSLNCMKEKMQVMLSKGPRVFHIGEW